MSRARQELGPCCGCRTTRRVRTIIMLPRKNTIPGHGWGCVQCGLPADGASVVLCDDCAGLLSAGKPIHQVCRDACRGYPGIDGRVPYTELTGEHRHDMSHHPEAEDDA